MLPARLRSLLFAPAVRPDLVAKMPSTGADMIVIDLEDATPVSAKDEARAEIAALVAGAAGQVPVSVRVNDPSTPWFGDDISALPVGLAAVVVPKVETTDGLDLVADSLAAAGHADLPVLAGIETALGVADARATLGHSVVAAAYFGAEDYIADMGGVRTATNHEVLYARSQVVLAGRLAGVPTLDQVVTDFRDHERFRAEGAEARALGYVGKLCIHPAQVTLANEAFTPSPEEIERARRLVAAYDRASAEGVAAIDFEGQMVDEPLARQARRLLSLA